MACKWYQKEVDCTKETYKDCKPCELSDMVGGVILFGSLAFLFAFVSNAVTSNK